MFTTKSNEHTNKTVSSNPIIMKWTGLPDVKSRRRTLSFWTPKKDINVLFSTSKNESLLSESSVIALFTQKT